MTGEGEKILIVDDDVRLRRLLERFLGEQGYRVRAVEDVAQMDRLLAREIYSLIVLDLMLPGEDGMSPRELVARMKAVLRRQAPQVPGAPSADDDQVSFGEFRLNLATRELTRGDEVNMLTTGEFAVLKALVRHPREPLTRTRSAVA